MFIGSFVAFAAAIGLFGVRQSLAATPATAPLGDSDSIVNVFNAQGATNANVPSTRGERAMMLRGTSTNRFPVAVDRIMRRLPQLTKGLTMKKDGYLGRRNATSEDGRQRMVFVWFKDNTSMLKWYETQVEKQLLRPFFPELSGKKPKFYENLLPNRPVMVIATLTPNFKNQDDPRASAIGQASFEVFSAAAPALKKGFAFAPAS